MFGFITPLSSDNGVFVLYIYNCFADFLSAHKKSAIFHIKSPIKINFNVKLPIK